MSEDAVPTHSLEQVKCVSGLGWSLSPQIISVTFIESRIRGNVLVTRVRYGERLGFRCYLGKSVVLYGHLRVG